MAKAKNTLLCFNNVSGSASACNHFSTEPLHCLIKSNLLDLHLFQFLTGNNSGFQSVNLRLVPGKNPAALRLVVFVDTRRTAPISSVYCAVQVSDWTLTLPEVDNLPIHFFPTVAPFGVSIVFCTCIRVPVKLY